MSSDQVDKKATSLDKKRPLDDVDHVEDIQKSPAEEDFDNSIDDTRPSKAVWMIVLTVAMGGFLFGYDTGVISAVLVNLGTDLGHKLSSKEQELITSITSGGALIGAIMAGLPADKYGRKFGIYFGCVLFLAGSVIQAAAYSVVQMTIGRFVVGLGVGSAAMIVPLYISELAPTKYRGRMISFDNLSVTFGQLVSYALGAGLTHVEHGWRYMVAIGGVPPILLAICLTWCPESPRQLLMHRKVEEARKAIARVYPDANEAQVQAKMDIITYAIEYESNAVGDKSLWWQFKQLHCVPSNLRALISACAVMAISQLGGFNTLMYYSATLFGLVGFTNPTAVSITVGATNCLFTLVNMATIDRAGRRLILIITVLGMSIAMAVTAIAFHWIPVSPDLSMTEGSVNWAGILVLVAIIIYVAFFASGVATIGWVGTELLPLEVRALGTMMNTVTCWGCNIIIASTFLSMMQAMTPSGAFGFYSGICFAGWVFVIFCYPEVNGIPLEDVRQIFEHGFGVREAKKMQKERKQQQQQQQGGRV
ncbi:general substrate transporter [Camillea tinctor]|nr:general substrate transporter [Camillea tinctor]